MNLNQIERARHARVTALVAQQYPDAPPDLQARIVEEYIDAELRMEAVDYAERRDELEATECVESCDFWRTGEGQYHGIIH